MPQMAPYNWFMLNIMFSLILLIFITIMYFTFNINPLYPSKKNLTNKFNMKW